MELRLQQFIESVETLAEIRNLDTWNPIVFQIEHPVNASVSTLSMNCCRRNSITWAPVD
jgi:hypothetical protein